MARRVRHVYARPGEYVRVHRRHRRGCGGGAGCLTALIAMALIHVLISLPAGFILFMVVLAAASLPFMVSKKLRAACATLWGRLVRAARGKVLSLLREAKAWASGLGHRVLARAGQHPLSNAMSSRLSSLANSPMGRGVLLPAIRTISTCVSVVLRIIRHFAVRDKRDLRTAVFARREATLYDTLGLRTRATPEQIKSAYRKLARKYHPDCNGGNSSAGEKFKAVQAAYDILGDPDKRDAYDRRVSSGGDAAAH